MPIIDLPPGRARTARWWAVTAWIVLLTSSSFAAPVHGNQASTTTDPLSTGNDPHFRRGQEVEIGPLEAPKQGGTLPFQVPFVLKGTVKAKVGPADEKGGEIRRFRVHLLDAAQPFRVEVTDEELRCYLIGRGRGQGARKAVWTKDHSGGFDGYEPEAEKCGLVLDVGHWAATLPVEPESAEKGDVPFQVLMPGVGANQHYGFGFQVERTLRARDREVIEGRLDARLRFHVLRDARTTESYLRKLCSAYVRVARDVLEVRTDASWIDLEDASCQFEESAGLRARNVIEDEKVRQVINLSAAASAGRQELRRRIAQVRERVSVAEEAMARLETTFGTTEAAFQKLTPAQQRKALLAEVKTLTEWRKILDSGGECADCLGSQECTDEQMELCQPFRAATELVNLAKGNLQAFNRKAKEVSALVDHAAQDLVADHLLWAKASTVYDFKTRQKMYLSADLGFVGGVGDVDEVVPYLGTNIYFSPVNKEAVLRWREGGWRTRCGATVGVTLDGVADGRTRDDLFSETSLVMGGGCRITEAVRLGVGGLLFKKRDPNPLVDDTELSTAPYLSISVDWDVREFFSGINRIFSSFTGRAVPAN